MYFRGTEAKNALSIYSGRDRSRSIRSPRERSRVGPAVPRAHRERTRRHVRRWWRRNCNGVRPHSSLADRAPAEFAATLRAHETWQPNPRARSSQAKNLRNCVCGPRNWGRSRRGHAVAPPLCAMFAPQPPSALDRCSARSGTLGRAIARPRAELIRCKSPCTSRSGSHLCRNCSPTHCKRAS